MNANENRLHSITQRATVIGGETTRKIQRKLNTVNYVRKKGDNISEIELRPVQLKLNHMNPFQFPSIFFFFGQLDRIRSDSIFKGGNFLSGPKKERENE